MKRLVARAWIVGAVLSLTACYQNGSPAPAPSGVAVAEGDQSATVSWTPDSGVTYWVWCAQGTSITTENAFSLPGLRIVTDASSPVVMSGLTNGTTYSCMVNGRYDGGPGGPGSPSLPVVPRLAGATWTLSLTPLGTGALHGATFGSTFVAVGDAGVIFISSDGKTWTTIAPPTTNNLYATTFGGSYVAVGQGGTILTSADAVTWTPQTSGTTNDLNAVATTGGGYYVAIGQAGTILYSSGGATWTAPATSPVAAAENLTGVAYGGGRFVAVGDQGGIFASVNGGLDWSAATPAASALYAVAYGVDTTQTPNVAMFVAVGASGAVLTSADGATWTAQALISTGTLRAVTYGRQFIAVGEAGIVYTSADGVNWQPQVSTTPQNLLAITHNSGAPFGYVAVGSAGTNLTAY